MRGRIESLAYGPHGIARAGGKVYFVRGAAPGDEVEFEVREQHRSYAFAEIVSLLHPGEVRRQPPCEYLPRCGGCPWQHVRLEAQRDAKQRAVTELLRRVARIEAPEVLPILAVADEFGYRRRLSLRVEKRRIGYFAGASHELVPVDHCLLAAPALAEAIPLAQKWVGALSTRVKRIEVAAAGDGDRLVCTAQAEGQLAPGDDEISAAFLAAEARVQGLTLRGRGWHRLWGDDRVRIPLATGESIAVRAGSFTQVNAVANELLVGVVLDFAGCTGSESVLDLYAGFGNLTFPLARRAREVLAVELDADSAAAGEAHARAHGYAGVSFIANDAAAALTDCLRRRHRPEVVVLDPPRSGAADASRVLLDLAPPRIVYVSCNPSTLARDIAGLAARYRTVRVQPIDFFPQTYHVESVAELVLTDP